MKETTRVLQAVPNKDTVDYELERRAFECAEKIMREYDIKHCLTDIEIAYILKDYGFHFELFERWFDVINICWRVSRMTDTEKGQNEQKDI